jgi:two-component system, OmpR family, heavy metal sensor histidine kinase CusS
MAARSGNTRPPTADPTAGHSSPELIRKKQRLAALMVHELRNPLAALSGNLEMLKEELVGQTLSPIAVESLADCMNLVGKVQSLCATILDVDELEDGVLRAQRTAVDIDAVIRRALITVDRPIKIRALQVEVDVPGGLVSAVDHELFARVVENLLDNAVRYAPRNGRLWISARRELGELELCIGNDGPPVADSERDAIFSRYYRIEARKAGVRAGRGLGLYFCRLAIEAHSGTIAVEQRGALGAVFVARLPEP